MTWNRTKLKVSRLDRSARRFSIGRQLNPIVLVLLLSFLTTAHACRRDTTITIRGSNAPTFEMSGTGTLGNLRVRGDTLQRDALGEPAFTYWKIEPKGDSEGVNVERLGSITYGRVPNGYVQVYPEQGDAPPLIEGERYYVYASTNYANGAGKYFTIQKGKALELPDQ